MAKERTDPSCAAMDDIKDAVALPRRIEYASPVVRLLPVGMGICRSDGMVVLVGWCSFGVRIDVVNREQGIEYFTYWLELFA
jgi:hypothetical protein